MAEPGPTQPMSGETFDAIIERSQDTLYRYARKLTNDSELAKDVVQNALIAAWLGRSEEPFAVRADAEQRVRQEAPSFDALDGAIRAWLLKAVYWQARSAVRREARHRHMPALFLEELPDLTDNERMGLSDQEIDNLALHTALARLPAVTRHCYTLHVVHGLHEQEISAIVHLPAQRVKERIRYAGDRLAQALRAVRVHAPKGVEKQ